MKETTKRLLSLVLCFVMVVGLLPALSLNANAAETVIDAAIFCSDVHGSTSDLTSVLGGVAKSSVDYSSIGFVGDTCLTVADTTSIVQSALGDTNISVMFSYASSHDKENSADIATNWDYSGEVEGVSDNYLVYTIRETDMETSSGASAAAPDFTTWYNGLTAAQKALPIFIMSHRPLHDRRDDNDGAATWYDAISAAAETSDIVFFWAHNHTSESSVDTDAYYVEKNGTETFTVCNGDTVTPNFTYMNAGYINANGQNPARLGVATTVQITANSLIFQDYNSSGEYSGTYAHNVTVARTEASADSGDSGSTDETTTPTETTVPTETTEPSEETTTPSEGTTEGNVTDYGTYNEVTLGGETTETKTKTVYVLVDEPENGEEYLIVSNDNALVNNSGSASAVSVTDNGSITINGTTYSGHIELDNSNAVWTAGTGWTFKNGSYYLGYSSSSSGNQGGGPSQGGSSYSVALNTSSTSWTYNSSDNYLYVTTTGSSQGGPSQGSSSCYIYYGSNGWSLSSDSSGNGGSSREVLFYKELTYTETTTTDSTVKYTMRAEDLSVVVGENHMTGALSYCLQGNGADLSTLPSGGEYTFRVLEDENTIIDSITDGTVNFTGTVGTATVEVAYTWTADDGETYTVYRNITVTATEPYYTVQIKDGDKVVSGTTISKKGVTEGQTLDLTAAFTYTTEDGTVDLTELPEGATLTWEIPEEYQSIATVDQNGKVTFEGVSGAFYVTATLTINGKDYVAGVNISATTSLYSVPSDGTTDFPEYPNEGAIRFDKTATAVGNFSQTGIAQVELSMTGVPYTTDNAMDVVVMLDMTGSMSTNGMEAAELATIAFVEKIVKNEDGSYNNNRVAVYAFNSGSSSPYELVSLKSISSDDELDTANTAIKTASDKQSSGGTPFDESAQKCYDVLTAAKTDGIGNNRQQFCVYMSDGGPTSYAADDGDGTYTTITNSGSGTTAITTYLSGYSSSTSSSWSFTLPSEYYTNLMKANGVTVYTVGLLLQTAPSNPAPYSSMTDSTYDSTTDSLTSIGSHYYFTSNILKQMASSEDKYIDIFDVDNADNATAKFTAIAESILEAATDVVVQDKIADDYTMVFDIPTGAYEDINEDVATLLENQEFYIEFVQYALDDDHERTTETSLLKLYLDIDSSTNTYYAASDNSGTKYADPVFTAVATDDSGAATEVGYWSVVDSTYAAAEDEIVINVNGTYYKFIADGSGDYNMTSGAYAYGTIDETTSTSQDLVIVTPHFAYSAATRMLAWTTEKLTTVEYALRYFLFLDNSSTDVGKTTETDSGPYETNDWATITYTNFNGNRCQQYFPIPQMTWNGATVSYVFYLVNEAGQPINKSGQVVDFANATFITDVYTHTVVWNGPNAQEELNVEYLADELLPDDYTVYDEMAQYTIHVYQDEAGNSVFDYFIIEGSTEGTVNATNGNTVNSDDTTKVYNTKAGTKYSEYGIYSAEEVGTNFTTTDANGNTVTITTTKQASLDYSDTTVAFAVVWKPYLVEDVVVVDYGLDVLINVVQNDNLQNTVGGIGLGVDAYGKTKINTGVSTASKLDASAKTTSDGSTISIENENQIRFHQNDMQFEEAVIFYYESPVEFWEGSNKQEGYMYSSVTVIPATTIYYEDSFVQYRVLDSNTWQETTAASWVTETDGSSTEATQEQDRPGESQISDTIDADNLYGSDSAYVSCSKYSLGSAKKLHVSEGISGEMIFTFWGTGFDVISMTSNTTGTIIVDLYDPSKCWSGDTFTYDGLLSEGSEIYDGTIEHDSLFVDTYYGYTYDGEAWSAVDSNDPNALYQVPVIKMENLPYGKYTVVITAGYNTLFDHGQYDEGGYDFYLDAIRIYDPANDGAGDESGVIEDAYVADGEGWPAYTELREMLVSADTFSDTAANGEEVPGIIFIDGDEELEDGSTVTGSVIGDYANYGPNNELYLAPGQAVAFKLNAGQWVTDADGTTTLDTENIAKVQIGLKSVGLGAEDGTTANVRIYDATRNLTDVKNVLEIATATDMYYDITALNGKVVVIHNAADSGTILSVTNLKVTFVEDPEDEMDLASMMANVVTIDGSAGDLVLYSVNYVEPEETEPEIFEPEVFRVSLNKSTVKVGQKVRVTVTTSSDVDYVTVNGQQITNYTLNSRTGLYTWTITLTASEEGTMLIESVAYNADGVASEPISQVITVRRSGSNRR